MAENGTERGEEKSRRTAGLAAAAGAAFIPFGFGSAKVVVLGQENFFTCICAVFNVIKSFFGGAF